MNFKLSKFVFILQLFLRRRYKFFTVIFNEKFSFLHVEIDEILFFFSDEIHRRRQLRTRKERLEKRRQQQAELVESQKLFSQCKKKIFRFVSFRFVDESRCFIFRST